MVTDLKSMLATWHPLRDEQQWVLATLYKIEGSSYRKLGAMMLISSLGQRLGMLSGGCLEADIQRHAKQVMTSLTSKTITYDATDEDDLTFQLGIGCGGVVHIVLQPVNSANKYLNLDFVFNALKEKVSGYYLQPVQPLCALGQGVFSKRNVSDGLSVNRKAQIIEKNNQHWLQVAVYPAPHILIVGGGADAVAVYSMAKQLGWVVTVWDPRAANAKRQYFQQADAILRCPPQELTQYCEKQKVDASILMAHSVELDANALYALNQSNLKYMGLLGPKHRRAQVFEQANIAIQEVKAPVFGPVGLNLGGDSPESIALSLISEIHAVLSNKDATSLSNWGSVKYAHSKVLLAAGQSSRFDGCKLIANVGNNKTMIARAVDVLQQLDAGAVYVVSGAWHNEITQALKHYNNVEIICNLDWQQGLGKSIALAANQLRHSGGWDGILFMLADQIELEACDIQQLVTRFQNNPTRWCANYGERLGVPAIFPHDDFDLLTTLSNDKGAQHLLRESGGIVNCVLLNKASADIDTVEQLNCYTAKQALN